MVETQRSPHAEMTTCIDFTMPGQINSGWRRRQEACKAHSKNSGELGDRRRALKALEKHCLAHPKDKRAAEQRSKLESTVKDLAASSSNSWGPLRAADRRYRQMMIRFAGIPLEHCEKAEAHIIDQKSGETRISFGHPDHNGRRPGCYILGPDGKLHCVRKP